MGPLHIPMYLPEIRAHTFALAILVSSADSDTEAPGINPVLDSFFNYIYIQNP